MLPSSETVLAAGDVVHLSATWQGIEALWPRLTAGEPGHGSGEGSQADSLLQEG